MAATSAESNVAGNGVTGKRKGGGDKKSGKKRKVDRQEYLRNLHEHILDEYKTGLTQEYTKIWKERREFSQLEQELKDPVVYESIQERMKVWKGKIDDVIEIQASIDSVVSSSDVEIREYKYHHDFIKENWETIPEIPKMPMHKAILRAKGVDPVQCERICNFGQSICNISDDVAGILAWNRMADSEAGSISRNDYILNIVKKLSGGVVIRDTHDVGSSHLLRTDACTLSMGIPVVRFEEKTHDTGYQTAMQELNNKMVTWLSQYGTLPYIIGVAIAGNQMSLSCITRGTKGRPNKLETKLEFNMSIFDQRVDAVKVVVHLGNWVKFTKESVLSNSDGLKFGEKTRRGIGGWIKITPWQVTKKYQDKGVCRKVYEVLTAAHEIKDIIRVSRSNTDSMILQLVPVGHPRLPKNRSEMAKVIITVLEVLVALHALGWCHCDLRWPNIVFVDEESRPMLIDFEFSRKIGDKCPRMTIQDPRIVDCKWDEAADIYQVGMMIKMCDHATPEDNEAAETLTNGDRSKSNARNMLDYLQRHFTSQKSTP